MKAIEIFCNDVKIPFKKGELLSKYTTLKIGGEASIVVFPNDGQIRGLMEVIKNESIPYYVIGGGSNLLVSDRGFRGVIINTKRMDSISIEGYTLKVSAGVSIGRILAFMLKRGISGMEGLAGIPGTIGGAIYGNAGSFGYEIKDCLEEVEVIDTDLRVSTLNKYEINFQYRSSGLPQDWLIISAKFQLKEDDGGIFYRIREFLGRRRKSQPLRERSAGCVFKNPDGNSAGFLIDRAGLKGTRIGDIEVSCIHANYFINIGNGSSEDFLRLMELVRERVLKVFSVELKPEIRFLGV